MATRRFTHSRRFEVPATRLWELVLDVEAWPDVTPTMSSVVRTDQGPLQIGSTARITQPGIGERTWTVTELDPARRFAWETTLGRIRMRAAHDLTAEGPQAATQTLTVELEGPGAGLLALLAGRQMRRTLALENEGFAIAAAEVVRES